MQVRGRSVVLLVQADPDARSLLASALEQAGLQVAESGCGAEAIALASEVSPSLAVVDSQLSDIQSCELISHLKSICPIVTELSLDSENYGSSADSRCSTSQHVRTVIELLKQHSVVGSCPDTTVHNNTPYCKRSHEEKLEILLDLGESLYSARDFYTACKIGLDKIVRVMSETGGIAAIREDGIDIITVDSRGQSIDTTDLVRSAFQISEAMDKDQPFTVSGALVFPAKLQQDTSVILAVLNIEHADDIAEDPLVIRLGKIISRVLLKLFHHESLHERLDLKSAELERFRETGQAVLQAQDSWDSAVGMLDNIALLAGASGCVLFARIAGTMQVVAHTGGTTQIPQGTAFSRNDTIAWSVLEMGEPILIHDIKNNGLRLDRLVAVKANIESALYMPLFYSGRSLGVLAIGYEGETYANLPSMSEPSLNALAAQAALLVDGIRLLEKAEGRIKRLRVLKDLAEAAASTLELEEIAEKSLESLKERTSSGASAVYLIDYEQRCLRLLASNNIPDHLHESIRVMDLDDSIRVILSQAESINQKIMLDMERAPLSKHQREMQMAVGLDCLAVFPLNHRGKVEGFMLLGYSGVRRLSEADEHLLAVAADQLAVAIANARLYQELDVEHRKLAATFDAIPGVICVCDPTGKMIMTNGIGNQMMVEEFGRWPDGFNTEGIIKVTRPDGTAYSSYEIPVARSIAHGEWIWGEQVILEFPSGKTIAALVNSAPMYSSDGAICGGVMILLDISDLRTTQIELQQSLDREQRVAERLQTAFLPADLPEVEGFDIAGKYVWAREDAGVGGDFYDIFQLPDGNTGIVIADVSGKGVQAAVYTAMTKYMLRAYALEGLSPDSVISKLNQALCSSLPMEYFVTLFFGVIDSSTRKLRYVNAGHEQPFLLNRSKHCAVPLDVTGRALGLFPQSSFAVREISIQKSDVLLLYTDGVTEYPTPGGMLGIEGLTAILEGIATNTARDIVYELWNALCREGTGRVRDDVAILCLRAV